MHGARPPPACHVQVRQIGVSNETSYGVMRFLQAARELNLPKIVSIQKNYSLLVRLHFDVNLAEVCHPRNENIALLAYSPLAGGSLSGKYIDGTATSNSRFNLFASEGSRLPNLLLTKVMCRKAVANSSALHQRRKDYMARYNKTLARQAVEDYAGIAHKHGLTPTQLALAWNTQRWPVTSTITGATSMEQLKVHILM